MNKEGLYDIEASYKIAEMTKNGDPKRLEHAKKLVDICAKGTYYIIYKKTKVTFMRGLDQKHVQGFGQYLSLGNVVKQMCYERMAKRFIKEKFMIKRL